MKKRQLKGIVLSTLLLFCYCLSPVKSYAENEGGELQTNGVIQFHEKGNVVPEELDVEEQRAAIKPLGRYPSTGELVKNSLSFGGFLLFISILIYLWKSSKRKKGGIR